MIIDGVFKPSHAGEMVQSVWDEIPYHYPGIESGSFVVMPNHIHAIIKISHSDTSVGAGPRACPVTYAHPIKNEHKNPGQPQGNISMPSLIDDGGCQETGQPRGVASTLSLPDIVHRFKSLTTKRYGDGVKNNAWKPYPGRLWQRNYYEQIIRNDDDYNRIANYIENNPKNWKDDELWIK
ncbi:MAG: transposase [Clostridiales bacterium]|nr:transposase [Clostridiales bacterium]